MSFLLYSHTMFVVSGKRYASGNSIFRDFGPRGAFSVLLCVCAPDQSRMHRKHVKNGGHWHGEDGFSWISVSADSLMTTGKPIARSPLRA